MAISSTDAPVSPLRQRMQHDMLMRGLGFHTQQDYVRHVRRFAAFLGRAPDTATPEDVRRFQRGFHRIRHFGLLAGSARKTSLALARELLDVAAPPDLSDSQDPVDFRPPCPCCGGRMIIIEAFERWRQPRGPPGTAATSRETEP